MDAAIQVVVKRYFKPFQEEALREVKESGKKQLQEWNRLLDDVRTLVPDYTVKDFSNLDNDWCFIAEILLHEGQKSFLDDDKELLHRLGGKKRSLTTFVSILAPWYYYYISEMGYDVVSNQFVFSYYQPTERESEEVVQPTMRVIELKGYRLLPAELAKRPLPDIETECLEKGQVTVFNCLFSELFTVH